MSGRTVNGWHEGEFFTKNGILYKIGLGGIAEKEITPGVINVICFDTKKHAMVTFTSDEIPQKQGGGAKAQKKNKQKEGKDKQKGTKDKQKKVNRIIFKQVSKIMLILSINMQPHIESHQT